MYTNGQIINHLILAAGAWEASGCQDKELEDRFESWLKKLQENTGLNRDGATAYLMVQLGERVAA